MKKRKKGRAAKWLKINKKSKNSSGYLKKSAEAYTLD